MKKRSLLVPLVLVLLGLIFIGLGLMRKEHLVVARKSNQICLECIGID